MAVTREQFYKHFGPRQIETVVRYVVQELNTLRNDRNNVCSSIISMLVPQLNILRTEHGMNELTESQALNALFAEIGELEDIDKDAILEELQTIWDSIPAYDWMDRD